MVAADGVGVTPGVDPLRGSPSSLDAERFSQHDFLTVYISFGAGWESCCSLVVVNFNVYESWRSGFTVLCFLSIDKRYALQPNFRKYNFFVNFALCDPFK